jgi:aldose 1-epimerase
MTAAVWVHRWRGEAAITLASGELEATFLPELNMLGVSLRLGGEEFLALPGGVATYRRRHATGLPLLAPWANRLDGWAYRVGRVRVSLDGLDLTIDQNGLPIHGTTWRESWNLNAAKARGGTASLQASLAYDRPDQLAAFPFPHELLVAAQVDGRVLSIDTSVRATGDRGVPISFGYHPYLRLPSGRRDRWRLVLPDRKHLELSTGGIPTGRATAEPAEADVVGARTFDDLYELGETRTAELEGPSHRLRMSFVSGYPFMQIYAPPRENFVCLEPMTAPTNALTAGTCPTIQPGGTFAARFSIRPERTRPN